MSNTEDMESLGQILVDHYTLAAERYKDETAEFQYGAALIGAIREFMQGWDETLREMLEGNDVST